MTNAEHRSIHELREMAQAAGYVLDASRWGEVDYIGDGVVVATHRRRRDGKALERAWLIEILNA